MVFQYGLPPFRLVCKTILLAAFWKMIVLAVNLQGQPTSDSCFLPIPAMLQVHQLHFLRIFNISWMLLFYGIQVLFVDADFCGLFATEDHSNSTSDRSRTEFIIKLLGCPLFWFIKLQACITCSTTEAEYVASSTALKTLLPMKEMILEGVAIINISYNVDTTVRALVFEDKQSAYYLSTNHCTTNRTRYFFNK